MIRHFDIDATQEFLDNPELRSLLLPAVRADFAMAFSYRSRPTELSDTGITCFIGRNDPYVRREDALEWGRYSRTSFRLWVRETAHFLIVDDRDFLVDTVNRELRERATTLGGGRHG